MDLREGPHETPKPGLSRGRAPQPSGPRSSGHPVRGPLPVSQRSCPGTCSGSALPPGHSLKSLGVTCKADPSLALAHSSGRSTQGLGCSLPCASADCPGSSHTPPLRWCLLGLPPFLWHLVQAGTCPLPPPPPQGTPGPSTEVSVFGPGRGLPQPYLQLFPQTSLQQPQPAFPHPLITV